MWTILAIVLSIIFMTICACLWRADKKDDYYKLECWMWFVVTFMFCPMTGYIITFVINVILVIFKLWLIPIILIIVSVLVFVYWDDLVEWLKDKKDGDEQCG